MTTYIVKYHWFNKSNPSDRGILTNELEADRGDKYLFREILTEQDPDKHYEVIGFSEKK